MFRLLWATDVHLNFLYPPNAAEEFGIDLSHEEGDAIVLTGDISEAIPLTTHLAQLERGLKKPVYFVLGNHDYYNGDFESVNRAARGFNGWLSRRVVSLSDQVALTGQEGWYDAMVGNPNGLEMSDWRLIAEYRHTRSRDVIVQMSRTFSEQSARAAEPLLLEALKDHEKVIFATHFPPFPEASWHEGAMSGPIWVPWFCSKLMGEMLGDLASQHPTQKILTLCGHSHSSGVIHPLENLTVLTGEAAYGAPDLAGVLEIEGADISVTMKMNRKWRSVDV